MKDLYNRVKQARLIDPQVQTNSDAAIVSSIVDLFGYESAVFSIITGNLSDADAVFDVKVEEGNNSGLSDAALVASTDLQIDPGFDGVTQAGQSARFTFAKDNVILKIGYFGIKRYVRVTITPTGNNAGSAPVAGVATLSNARHLSPTAGVTQVP